MAVAVAVVPLGPALATLRSKDVADVVTRLLTIVEVPLMETGKPVNLASLLKMLTNPPTFLFCHWKHCST